jgi:hypothetical protein
MATKLESYISSFRDRIDPQSKEINVQYQAKVGFDTEHGRYYLVESDIPGLNVEATTFEEFIEIVADLAPDLLGKPDLKGVKISFYREVMIA